MGLGRQGYAIDLVIHPMMWIRRDPDGQLLEVLESGATGEDALAESILHIEVARETDRSAMARLAENVERVLEEVRAAVEDWRPMRERTQALIHEVSTRPPPIDEDEREEAAEFLPWVAADH